MDGVEVRESPIHGKGVFATRDFSKGEVVIKWDTTVKLDRSKLSKIHEDYKKYAPLIDGEHILLLMSPEAYINHSCKPNTKIENYCEVAVRDIKEGEEITGDYSKERLPDLDMACNCRSSNCRKIIRTGE